jgi:class 3 adenylate cyclase
LPKINLDINELVEDVLRSQSRQMIDAELEPPERGRIAVNLKLSPLRSSVKDTQGVTILVDDMTEAVEREEMLGIMKRYLPPEMVENIQSIAQLGLGGVRREMTCLFVDVRPITSFPKDTRPQQLMEMLNVYLATATQCIHEAGGVIDKYMGNIIMALFNTQLNPHDDHAFRAVEAALTMRDAFVRLYQELGIDPDPHYYHVGIHTGVATLGNVGSLNRRDFTAIGDTINLAKRLEENAADSQIVISGNGREHIEKHNNGQPLVFRFEERDPIQVKGRTEKTRIYEVFRS